MPEYRYWASFSSASTFHTFSIFIAVTIARLLHVGWTLTFCFNHYCMHPNHTWPSVILRFVQHRWMLFLILNLIVVLCIISLSCCSTCLQLVSTSSLMHFTLTLLVRYTETSDLLLVCKMGRVCTIPYHYDHYCTDNNKNLYIYIWRIGFMSTIYLEAHFFISVNSTLT